MIVFHEQKQVGDLPGVARPRQTALEIPCLSVIKFPEFDNPARLDSRRDRTRRFDPPRQTVTPPSFSYCSRAWYELRTRAPDSTWGMPKDSPNSFSWTNSSGV